MLVTQLEKGLQALLVSGSLLFESYFLDQLIQINIDWLKYTTTSYHKYYYDQFHQNRQIYQCLRADHLLIHATNLYNYPMEYKKSSATILRQYKERWCDPDFPQINSKISEFFDQDVHQSTKKNSMKGIYSEFSYTRIREFLCCRIFRPFQKNIIYTCEDCRQEFNSIICGQCFDVSLHKGHRYQSKLIPSGSCDCGDKTKWKEQGFCKKHQYYPEPQILTEKQKERYSTVTFYFIKTIHHFYKIYSDKSSKLSNREIDNFGKLFFEHLIETNKNREGIIKLTTKLLYQVIYDDDKEKQVIDILLEFISLPQTSQKCVELFLLLFYNNDALLKQMTIKYFERYGEFIDSSYNEFNKQLLSNGLMISQLCKEEDKREKLPLVLDLSDISQYGLQKKLRIYKRHFDNLLYLISLNQRCSQHYWNCLVELNRFYEIGNYRYAFAESELTDIKAKHYDKFQHVFLTTMTKILQLMIQLKDQEFFKNIIRQLFQKITIGYQSSSQQNYFFTYERLWTMAVYVFLVNRCSSFKGIEDKNISSLFKILKLTKQKIEQKLTILAKKTLTYFNKTDFYEYLGDGQINIKSQVNKDYQNFEKSYMKNYFLFSIDAILFKVLLKMIVFYDKHYIKNLKNSLLNQSIKSNTSQDNPNSTTKKSLSDQKKQIIKNSNTISQIHECMYSDRPDLILASCFSKFRILPYYQQAYIKYYHNILFSLNQPLIRKNEFQFLTRALLCFENQAFIKFIKETQGVSDMLDRSKSKGNLLSYSFSLRLILLYPTVTKFISVDDIVCIPYDIEDIGYYLSQSKCFKELEQKLSRTLSPSQLNKYKQLTPGEIDESLKMAFYYNLSLKLAYKILFSEKKSNKFIENFSRWIKKAQFQDFSKRQLETQMYRYLQNLHIQRLEKLKQLQQREEENQLPLENKDQQQEQQQKKQMRKGKQKNQVNNQQLIREQWSQQDYQNLKNQQQQQIKERENPPSNLSGNFSLLNENIKEKDDDDSSIGKGLIIKAKGQVQMKMEKVCYNLKCNLQSRAPLYLICCATSKLVPDLFQMQPNRNSLVFTSCNHSYHKQCLPSSKKCLRCQARFNLSLPYQLNQIIQEEPDNQMKNQHQKKEINKKQQQSKEENYQKGEEQKKQKQLGNQKQQIQKEVQKGIKYKNMKDENLNTVEEKNIIKRIMNQICNAIQINKRQGSTNIAKTEQTQYLSIFESLIIFTLQASTVDRSIFQERIQVYSCLFKILKHYLANRQNKTIDTKIIKKIRQSRQNKQIKQMNQIQQVKQSEKVINYLIDLYGSKLINDSNFNYHKIEYKGLPLQSKQAANMEYCLQILLQDSDFKLEVKQGNRPDQQIKMRDLPVNLQMLMNNYMGTCSCSQDKKPVFIVCLLTHPQEKERIKRCILCYPRLLKEHLKLHEGQILTITTDSGYINYYLYAQNKIWGKEVGSVYLNAAMKPISVQQQVDQKELGKRQNYLFNKEAYQQIKFNFHSRKYLISKLNNVSKLFSK